MRVISQKGIGYTLDAPYEQVSVEERGSTVYLNSSTGTNARVIASYSTPEKAEKAMEKLHTAYVASLALCNPNGISTEELADTIKETASGNGCFTFIFRSSFGNGNASVCMINTVFRFPEDSEV